MKKEKDYTIVALLIPFVIALVASGAFCKPAKNRVIETRIDSADSSVLNVMYVTPGNDTLALDVSRHELDSLKSINYL